MSNRKTNSADKARAGGQAIAAAPDRRTAAVLWAVWGAIGVYLVLFFRTPLSTRLPGSDTVLRRWHVLVSMFFPDEIVPNWFEGARWHTLTERAWILAVAGAILIVAFAAGWICLHATKLDRALGQLETFVFSAAVGLNLVSLTTLALGLCGAMNQWVFALIAFLIVGAAAALARGGRSATRYPPAQPGNKRHDRQLPIKNPPAEPGAELGFAAHWLWCTVPFVLVILLGAMLPPIDFDVREYHLQAPKEFYQQGRITFLAHNVYANMPLGSEMLSLSGMIVSGDWWTGALVGKTLIALFAPLTALLLVAAGRRFATPWAGVVAALVYISIPWIALVSMQGLVEGAFAFYLFAALYCVLVWQETGAGQRRNDRFLWLAGFLAGGAVSCKYPAVVFCVLPLAAWIVCVSLAPKRGTVTTGPALAAAIKPLAAFLLFVALGCGLWFAKNAVLAGNPVYPLLYDVFDGRTRTAEKDQQWSDAHDPPNFELSDFRARAADVTLGSDWLSPLVMPLAALGLLGAHRRLAWGLAAYFGCVFVAWWLFTHRIDRFWIPILPVVALLAGIGATWSNSRWWRIPFIGLLLFGLASNFVVITSGVLGDNRFLADSNALRVDPRRVDPWHLYLNQHAGEVTGVLLVGDAQPFDLEVPATYNTVFDDSVFENVARGRTPEQLHRALLDRKLSHVYVDWAEVGRYRLPGNYGITDFLQPQVFDDLVAAGVLEEVPRAADEPNQLFRVRPLGSP